jgi:hypothetical protein
MSGRLFGQGLAWLLFALAIGLFAHWPAHSPLPSGHGELRLSLAHLTERMEPCRTLSEEERMALPPNMRIIEKCGRARASAQVELRLDERVLYADSIRPAGLHREGRTYLFRSWPLPAGDYTLQLALRDSPRDEGFDKRQQFRLRIEPGHSALLRVGDGDAELSMPVPAGHRGDAAPLPPAEPRA